MDRPGILAEFRNAFPAVLGKRFWSRITRIITVLVLLAVVRSTAIDCSVVPTGSMIPSILPGDRILVNKLAYDLKFPFTRLDLLRWANPERGDVIAFIAPMTGLPLVKRVIGLPGDTIELRDNMLYLNGIAAHYSPADLSALPIPDEPNLHQPLLMETITPQSKPHPIMQTPSAIARRTIPPTSLPPGKFFVMGDDRDESFDSRYFGFVDRSQILGRASRILISLHGTFIPRPTRLLRQIP